MKPANKLNKPSLKKNPLEFFFSLGDRATKGDPVRKASFDYALLWVMFLAFVSVLVSNLVSFIKLVPYDFFGSLKNLGWSFVMLAILWFQYQGLKGSFETKKLMKRLKTNEPELKVESVDEMLNNFKEEAGKSIPEQAQDEISQKEDKKEI